MSVTLGAYYVSNDNYGFDTRNYADTKTTEGPGLGQCHWIGGPYHSNSGIHWGYSSSTEFNFEVDGGDSWAAVEQSRGVYTFTQHQEEVNAAKRRGKQIWLQVQVADDTNKEHNVPQWAIEEGVETIPVTNCTDEHNLSKIDFPWDEGIRSLWNNPKLLEQEEAVFLDVDGNVTTNSDNAITVRFPIKIAAVWDPKFREYYAEMLAALKAEFQNDFDSRVIQAIVMMSGGRYGECALSSKCQGWSEWDGSCTPDTLNPSCPVIQSMAKFVQRQHYPELTVETVATQIIAKKSDCQDQNTIPGAKVTLCTESDPMNCPTKYGSFCYVFDDYFIQAEKDLIRIYVETFYPTPVVWQTGPGLSGTGRVNKVLEYWMAETYTSKIWMKWNGWGPEYQYFGTARFMRYSGVGARGYETSDPRYFSKDYFRVNAQAWCDDYVSFNCEEDRNCAPEECNTSPIDPNAVGRRAIVVAIQRALIDDQSSYLCMQSTFFEDTAVDNDPEGADGLLENTYFFNPDDQTETCATSEINTTDFGVGFCPGYLNHIMEQNVPVDPTGTCTRNCTDKACGTDGCGGSCGTCPTPETCTTAGVCAQSGTLRGDLNADGKVSVSDYALFITDYLAYIRDAELNIRSDLNDDGTISVSDYAVFIQAYMDYMAG